MSAPGSKCRVGSAMHGVECLSSWTKAWPDCVKGSAFLPHAVLYAEIVQSVATSS